MSEFDDFLEQRRRGGTFNSEGHFTVARLEALEKLGTHQFGEHGYWLVKLVQAAVVLGAADVQIRLTPSGVECRLSARPGINAGQLLARLLEPDGEEDHYTHLVAGLRALYARHQQLSWVLRNGSESSLVSLDQGQTAETSVTEVTEPRIEVYLHQTPSTERLVRSWLGQSLEQFGAVRERCWLAPIPVKLDGRALDGPAGHGETPLALWESRHSPFDLPMEALRGQPTGQALKTDPRCFWSHHPRSGELFLDRRLEPGQRPGMMLALIHGRSDPGRLYYVHDGALVEGESLRLEMSHQLSLNAYVRKRNLKLDLSGFKTSEESPQAYDDARGAALVMIDRFLNCCAGQDLADEGVERPSAKGAVAAVLGASVLGKVAPLALMTMGLPATLLGAGGYFTVRNMKRAEKRLLLLDVSNSLRTAHRQITRGIHH